MILIKTDLSLKVIKGDLESKKKFSLYSYNSNNFEKCVKLTWLVYAFLKNDLDWLKRQN